MARTSSVSTSLFLHHAGQPKQSSSMASESVGRHSYAPSYTDMQPFRTGASDKKRLPGYSGNPQLRKRKNLRSMDAFTDDRSARITSALGCSLGELDTAKIDSLERASGSGIWR
jgi:hypothetical protein